MRPSALLMRCLCRSSAVRPASAPSAVRIPRPQTLQPSFFRARPQLAARPQLSPFASVRHESTSSPSPKAPLKSTTTPPRSRLERDDVPAYELTFTCKACETRSSHRVSKQGYHKGTVLITCPGCRNRHLISDHLKIFSDKSVTIEDLMREKGQLVRRGSLSEEGDVEFWEDGTTTPRSAHFIPNSTVVSDPDAPEGTLTAPSGSPVTEESGKPAEDQFEGRQNDRP